jgi:hypothetical protein
MSKASLVESVVSRHPALLSRNGLALNARLEQVESLLLMYLANMAEQLPRLRHQEEIVRNDRSTYQRVRAYVPASIRAELDAVFERLCDEGCGAENPNAIEALELFISEAGGDGVLCGRTTLLGRLSDMDAWLVAHGAENEVRVAAYAQGLYGWKADFSDRNRAIVRLISSEAAERLAWLFSAADDVALAKAEQSLGVAGDSDRAIVELGAANGRLESVTKHELKCLTMLACAARATA